VSRLCAEHTAVGVRHTPQSECGTHRSRSAAHTAVGVRQTPQSECGTHRSRSAAHTAVGVRHTPQSECGRHRSRSAAHTAVGVRHTPQSECGEPTPLAWSTNRRRGRARFQTYQTRVDVHEEASMQQLVGERGIRVGGHRGCRDVEVQLLRHPRAHARLFTLGAGSMSAPETHPNPGHSRRSLGGADPTQHPP
jgi:hypothetical protein